MTGTEPYLLGAVASPLIEAALGFAIERLKEIGDRSRRDAEAAATYIDILSSAMSALEAESDMLLVTTMHLSDSPQSEGEATALVERIDELLYGEHIRPLLADIEGRLRTCSTLFAQDSRRFFGAVGPSAASSSMTQRIDDVIQYVSSYVDWLSPSEKPDRASAPWVWQVTHVRDLLQGRNYREAAADARRMLDERAPQAVDRNRSMSALSEQLKLSYKKG